MSFFEVEYDDYQEPEWKVVPTESQIESYRSILNQLEGETWKRVNCTPVLEDVLTLLVEKGLVIAQGFQLEGRRHKGTGVVLGRGENFETLEFCLSKHGQQAKDLGPDYLDNVVLMWLNPEHPASLAWSVKGPAWV